MDTDAVIVRPLPDYELYVELKDGIKGIFDMKPYLNRKAFLPLRSEGYFRQVSIVFGALTWPDDQDIAPQTLRGGLRITASADA
jgi:Protein of unknown function (DUF2442)